MSATTVTAIGYRDRIAELLREIADRNEDIREIRTEIRSRGLSDIEIAAVLKSARRVLLDIRRRERQDAIGQYVLQLEAASVLEEAAD
jgi:uncharacterized protein (UPF0335 family)